MIRMIHSPSAGRAHARHGLPGVAPLLLILALLLPELVLVLLPLDGVGLHSLTELHGLA